MLESTREYAAEKMKEAGEVDQKRRLGEYLRGYYAGATEAWPTTPTRDWIARHSSELDNLRASVEWAFGTEGEELLGLDLVGHSMRLLFEMALSRSLSGR